MRKFLILLLAFFCLNLWTAPCFAGDPGKKLGRGLINVLTFPLEIPIQTHSEWKRGREKTFHVLVWILSGFVKGSVYSIGRLGSGTWDILTFPLNRPRDYAPLMQPEFVFKP